MTNDVQKAIVRALQDQSAWMLSQAEEYETGRSQITTSDGQQVINRSQEIAIDLRRRAGNLQALTAAYDRLGS